MPVAAQGTGSADVDRCAAIGPPGEIVFHGQTLTEAPDLAPELRRANALLDADCLEQAESLRDEFVTSHPDDFRTAFLNARIAWRAGQRPRAEAIVNSALRVHPGFISVVLLLASMKLDDHDYLAAQRLLDEIEKEQPTDLWAYIDRLRLEAALTPSASTLSTMRQILEDSRFPQSVHRQILQTAQYGIAGVSDKERDALFQAAVEAQSCDQCSLAQQVTGLIEVRNASREAVLTIERYLGTCGGCVPTPTIRTLLAEAYLLQAAAIAPAPGKANATLFRKAQEALDHNFTPLAYRVAGRPILKPILPFLQGNVDHKAVDKNGATVICSAVIALDPDLVKEELDGRADPNGSCEQTSLLRIVLFKATTAKVAERQSILRVLLERGARVEGIAFCESPANGDCSEVLLPILKKFDDDRARGRETL